MRRRSFIFKAIKSTLLISPLWSLATKAQDKTSQFASKLKKISKKTHFPDSSQFRKLKGTVNQLLKPLNPLAIIQTENLDEIKETAKLCANSGVPVRLRSGGHSFEGFSMGLGLVIDVRLLKEMDIDFSQGFVKTGAGVTLGELRVFLDQHGLSFPTGNCPSVGLSGYLLGGGHSAKLRLWGLGADRVQAMDVVLASGQSLHVSPKKHKDLFWALLGGGGGNFAVVTDFYLDIIAKTQDVFFSVGTDQADFGEILSDWEEFTQYGPSFVSPNLFFSIRESQITSARLSGLITYEGKESDAEKVYKKYLPESLRRHFLDDKKKIKFLETYRPLAIEVKTSFKGTSQYADKTLGQKGFEYIQEVVSQLDQSTRATLEFIPMGGQLKKPIRSISYPHRHSLYHLGIFVHANLNEIKKDIHQSAKLHSDLDPLFSGRHYVNYPDFNLEKESQRDWAQRYYGDSLERLLEVKKKYDPENVFNFGKHSLSSYIS